MLLTLKRRLLFLVLVTLGALIWSGGYSFNWFSPSLPWQSHTIHSPAPEQSQKLVIRSFKNGTLLINQEPLFTIEKYTRDEHKKLRAQYRRPMARLETLMPRLLNTDTQDAASLKERVQSQFASFTSNSSNRLWSHSGNLPLQSIMRMDSQGTLQVVAWWLGNMRSLVCSPGGHCTLILTAPFDDDRIIWYSPDGGIHWQRLAQWQFPEPKPGSYELVAADDAGKLWIADRYTLFVSADQGKSWQATADIRPLLKRNNISDKRYDSKSPSLSELRWYFDNQQRLLADVIVDIPDSREKRRFLYNVTSSEREQLLAIDIRGIAQSPSGDIFITRRSDRLTRYGLYQLQNNGTFRQVLEHIDELREIHAGKTTLVLEKSKGDTLHRYISTDGGLSWHRYQQFEGNLVFDAWHDRFIRLPDYHPPHYYVASLLPDTKTTIP